MKKRRKLFYRHRLASSIFYLFSFAALICTVSIVYTSITSSLNISGEGEVDGPVNEYYYDLGYFYEDEDCLKRSGISKFSEAVQKIASPGTIYMKSRYVGDGTEEVTVGAKNIQVKRHPSFTGSNSMFDIHSGTFTIKAEDSSGSIVFDGNNVVCHSMYGGVFTVSRKAKFNIIGSEKSNGEKNVRLINNELRTSSTLGGAIANFSDFTIELTNCEISNNMINNKIYNQSSSDSALGGAINSSIYTTLVLNSCTIRNNIADITSDDAKGGGVYLYYSNMIITGKTIIEGNKSIINGVEKTDNLYLDDSSTVDTSGLTSGSRIGITTSETPTSDSNVTISPSGSAASTASYFFSDNSDYKVVKLSDGSIALTLLRNEYYYKSGYFYENEACTIKVTLNGSDVTKFSDMVNIAKDGNTIYMMSQYDVGDGTEEVTVGAKNIQVKRHPSFTNDSMFYIQVSSSAPSSEYKTFTIKAENSSGSIVFDGNNVYGDGIFQVYRNAKLNIIGSEKSNGEKNVKLINSKIKNSDYDYPRGGAIQNYVGTVDLTHCELSGNSIISSTEWAAGGAIFNTNIDSSTLNLNSCTIRNNIDYVKSYRIQGGGVYNGDSMTIKGKTIIENNKAIIKGVEETDNLFWDSSKPFDTSGLTSGSRIGIRIWRNPTSSSNVTISPSGSAASTADYFFSDNSDYRVVKLSDGSIVLTLCDK